MAQGIKLLKHQKYAIPKQSVAHSYRLKYKQMNKCLSIPQVPFHRPSLIKKTAALRLISVYYVVIGLIEPFGVWSYVAN